MAKKTHFSDLVNYSSLTSLFYYHEWSRQNFFLQYQCNIKQTSDEDKKYQLGDYFFIHQQILQFITKNCMSDSKENY